MHKCQDSIRKRAAANPDDRNTQILLVFLCPLAIYFRSAIRTGVFFANLFFFPPLSL